MTEKIVNFMLNILSGITNMPLGREITVFLLSMVPIIELRGGIIAARALGLSIIESFVICYIANLIPVPFILILIKKIIKSMEKSNTNIFNKFANWLKQKVEKNKGSIEKYGFWGLVLFVGIPLPGTGAWTGSLIAAMLDIDKKKAFLAACIGVFLAGIIISLLSIGIFDGILAM